jgi:hypothetical protein
MTAVLFWYAILVRNFALCLLLWSWYMSVQSLGDGWNDQVNDVWFPAGKRDFFCS